MNSTTNGRARKTLSEQLDRLDAILDGLSQALNESVAAAVREATAQAVQATLTEILTSPELMALLGAARTPTPAAPPTPPTPQAPTPASAPGWVGRAARAVRDACGRRLSALWPRVLGLWRLRRQLVVALGVGTAAGLAAYAAAPWVAGLLSGLATFGSALGVQARLWWGRLVVAAAPGCATP